MYWQARLRCRNSILTIERLAEHVEEAAQSSSAHRNRNRRARCDSLLAARESCRLRHGDGAHTVETEMGRDFERDFAMEVVCLDHERLQDCGAIAFEMHVDDWSDDFYDGSFVHKIKFKFCLFYVTKLPSTISDTSRVMAA